MSAPTDPRSHLGSDLEEPSSSWADDPADRAEILGRVLAGDITDREACHALGVKPTVLARWKLQALEAIERFDPDGLDPAGPEVTAEPAGDAPDLEASGPGPVVNVPPMDPTERLEVVTGDASSQSPPAPTRAVVDPRVLVAGGIGLLGFAVAAVLITPVATLTAMGALNRWLAYASCLLAVGGAVFLWRIHDHRGADQERATLRWWLQAGALTGVATALFTLAFQGAVLDGVGPFALLDPRVAAYAAAHAADGSLGVSVALRLVGLAYLVYAARTLTTRRTSGVVALVGGGLVLVSFLLVGHSATSEPRLLVAAANLTHTGAASVWFGGLALLAITMRHRRRAHDLAGAATIVKRFSRFAMASVAAVVVAGVALASVEIPRSSALVTSSYGLMILAKLVLVGVVLWMARQNHRRILPAMLALRPDAWGQLRRTVGVEIGGIVLILLATGLLVNLPPPS